MAYQYCILHSAHSAYGIVYTVHCTIVPTQFNKNAHKISLSESMRGTLYKPRRRQAVLVLLYCVDHV